MSAGKADSVPDLKYKCHTTKKLMMQRIFLVEKKEGETGTGKTEKLNSHVAKSVVISVFLIQIIEVLFVTDFLQCCFPGVD